MDKNNGRAAIITNGSPLFSGNTTSGESQIRRFMLENDLVEAIIALPSQLFYNTDISIYAFILSKNKLKDRINRIQLINAVDLWKPLKRSLGKKRREISLEQIKEITRIYSEFQPGPLCKIFDKEEFMYKEYSVWQPLQRRGVINAESIESLRTSAYFTSNSNIYNEADFAELEETIPRDEASEKKYQKYKRGIVFTTAVIEALKEHKSETVYTDYAKFENAIKLIIKDIDGYSASRLTGIAMEMSVMDKTAVIQKDRKGNIIPDPTTKDTEIIKLNQNVQKYFEAEVLPHVPDAIWAYEFDENKVPSSTNKEKLGAEFPFARFFYEYKAPEKADDLLTEFIEIELSLKEKIALLTGGDN
jgi:type I restriction enzyme M protein